MSERDGDEERRRRPERSGSRERGRHHERHAGSSNRRKRSRDRRSRSRSHSPHSRRRPHPRHEDGDRERRSGHKKHKRHRDDKGSRTKKHSSSRHRSPSPSASSASSPRTPPPASPHPPPFPSPSSLSTARTILTSLLVHTPTSYDHLLFLLFQLDHRRVVVVEDGVVWWDRSELMRLVGVLGLRRVVGEDGVEGWKAWDEWGDRKLLPELEAAFEAVRKARPQRQAGVEETKAEHAAEVKVDKMAQAIDPAPLIGPTLPPPSYRPPPAAQQPQPSISDQPDEEDEEDESDAGYGPRLASQLTAEETAALDHLQHARQHLHTTQQHIAQQRQHLTDSTTGHPPSAHEEWMTVAPAPLSKHAALLASMSGDRGLQGRAFAMRDGGGGGVRDSSGWLAGPEEREWKRVEREAERGVEKALAHLRAVQQRLYSKPRDSTSSDVSAARPAAGAEPSSSASSGAPSLLELHQQRLKADQSGGVRERGAPIFWDREKEMGMRRHKTDRQIAGELRGAGELSSRFALPGQ